LVSALNTFGNEHGRNIHSYLGADGAVDIRKIDRGVGGSDMAQHLCLFSVDGDKDISPAEEAQKVAQGITDTVAETVGIAGLLNTEAVGRADGNDAHLHGFLCDEGRTIADAVALGQPADLSDLAAHNAGLFKAEIALCRHSASDGRADSDCIEPVDGAGEEGGAVAVVEHAGVKAGISDLFGQLDKLFVLAACFDRIDIGTGKMGIHAGDVEVGHMTEDRYDTVKLRGFETIAAHARVDLDMDVAGYALLFGKAVEGNGCIVGADRGCSAGLEDLFDIFFTGCGTKNDYLLILSAQLTQQDGIIGLGDGQAADIVLTQDRVKLTDAEAIGICLKDGDELAVARSLADTFDIGDYFLGLDQKVLQSLSPLLYMSIFKLIRQEYLLFYLSPEVSRELSRQAWPAFRPPCAFCR